MSKTEEVPEDPKPNDGGGSAPVAEIEQQERLDLVEKAAGIAKMGSRIAELFIKTARALEGWEQRVTEPVPGSEDQKKENGPRVAEWVNMISRAYIVYSLSYFAGDVEIARQIKRIVDELDRLCGREKVDKLWSKSPFSTAAKRQAFEERVSAAVAV